MTSDRDGILFRVDRAQMRYLDLHSLGTFLTEAGFEIDAQYGDWNYVPLTPTSREIITVARA